MSAYMAGLALLRCAEHERAADIPGSARLVLAAMGSWVGTDAASKARPVCVASRASIAARAGVSVRAVADALPILLALGLIHAMGRTGAGLKGTVRYRLTLLCADSAHKSTEQGGCADSAHKEEADSAHKEEADSAHNPSDSVATPRERRKRGRSDVAAAPASGGPPAVAATSSKVPAGAGEPAGIVGEVMAARGCTQESAQAYIDRKLSAAGVAVRNESAFIRRCLANELAEPKPAAKVAATPMAATTARSTAKAPKSVGKASGRRSDAGKPRRAITHRVDFTPEQAEAAVGAVLRLRDGQGESTDAAVRQVAQEIGATLAAVNAWLKLHRNGRGRPVAELEREAREAERTHAAELLQGQQEDRARRGLPRLTEHEIEQWAQERVRRWLGTT